MTFEESWCTKLDPVTVEPDKEAVEEKPVLAKKEKKQRKPFLCMIGWHDFIPDGLGWGAGEPCVCSRCGESGTFSDFGVY